MSTARVSSTSSLLMSSSATLRSPARSASVPRASASLTIPASRTRSSRTRSRSWWKPLRTSSAIVFPLLFLAEPAGDVVLRPGVARRGEHRLGAVVLDQHARAGVALLAHLGGEERARVADAGRLLHVVGDDDDRVGVLDLPHELLDATRGDGVEGRAGLVHEDHLGIDGEG